MKPDDRNGKLPLAERPLRVLIIAGSDRRQYNCPGVDSKARALMLRLRDRLPAEWELDLEDLGNVFSRAQIRSCNACVSTSMALCVWPCNCYEPGSWLEPDLMWNLNLYARLDLADAWVIIGPVNWYAPSSNLKLMFDRLVCMNGGNPREDLIAHKDPALAMKLEHSPEWPQLSGNHLEGRTAAFFCYGDDGADETDASGRPHKLEHPQWFDPEHEPFDDPRAAYAPLVWQCRYSGIEVPDALFTHVSFGHGKKYSDNQSEHMMQDPDVLAAFDAFGDRFAAFVRQKGKVPPGPHRAFGYERPGHFVQDLRLFWQNLRMSLGRSLPGTSPRTQELLGISRDATFFPKRSERKRN